MTTIFLITLIFLIILLYPTMIENIKKYNNVIKIRFRKRVRKKCKNYWQLFYGKKYKDITYSDIEKCYNDIQEEVKTDIDIFKSFIPIYITIFVSIYGLIYFCVELINSYVLKSDSSFEQLMNVIVSFKYAYVIVILLFVISFIVHWNIYTQYNIIAEKEKHLYVLRNVLWKQNRNLYLYVRKYVLESHTFIFIIISSLNAFIVGYIMLIVMFYEYYTTKTGKIDSIFFQSLLNYSVVIIILILSVVIMKNKKKQYSYILKTKIIKV